MLNVKTNQRSFIAEFNRVTRKEFPRAHVRATNSAAFGRRGQGSVKGDLSKIVAKDTNLKVSSVKKGLKVKQRSKVLGGKIIPAEMDVQTRPFNIISLKGTRKTKKGISFNFAGKKMIMKGAFIIGSGKSKFVAKREGKSRLPIRGVHTPSIAGMVKQRYEEYIGDTYNTRYSKELKGFLRNVRPRRKVI